METRALDWCAGQGADFPLDGAFFAESESAAREFSPGRVIVAHINLQRPWLAEMADSYDGEAWRNPMAEQDRILAARALGHDGVIFVNARTRERYFVAFHSHQIRQIDEWPGTHGR